MNKINDRVQTQNLVRRTALLGILSGLSLVLSVLESWFTPFFAFLPVGVKLGFSNIVTMYAADKLGFFSAVYISLIKIGFNFLTRGFTAGLTSLFGNVLSLIALMLMLRFKDKVFSYIGISVLCAVMHSIGQLFVACAISGTFSLFGYAKYLIIFAVVTGSLTGTVLNVLMPTIEKIKI